MVGKQVKREFEQYAENTTIHGIKDFITSENRVLKVAWGLLLMGAAGMMCEEIYRTTKNYRDAPTAMDVQFVCISEFPTINIWIKNWFNDSKARSLGFDDKDLAYIKRIFEIEDSSPINAKYQDDMDTNSTFREQMKSDIKAKMEQHSLSSVEDMIGILSVDACSYPDIKRRWWAGGVLFSININFTSRNGTPFDETYIDFPKGYEGAIAFGEDPFGQNLFFWHNYTRHMGLKISEINQYKFLNKRRRFCNEKYQSMHFCTTDCAVEEYLCLRNGTSPIPTHHNNESFWQLGERKPVDENSSLAIHCDEIWESCHGKCQPCKTWNYEISDIGELYSKDERSILFIMSVTQMKVSEEYYSYKAVSFWGDVGGLVSLFCGASILSIAQLFMFCFGEGFRGKGKVQVDDAEERDEDYVKFLNKYC